MRVLVIIVVFAILGFFLFKKDDTGELCLSMYQSAGDVAECLWILNNGEN
jgi:hypothetical protein